MNNQFVPWVAIFVGLSMVAGVVIGQIVSMVRDFNDMKKRLLEEEE